MSECDEIRGPRTVLGRCDERFPQALRAIPEPPEQLFVIGDTSALREGLAVVGARKATPYGLGCAERFAGLAAESGIVVISGGARGCDAASHRAAVERGAPTVVFLGGGCDQVYPLENRGLFQRVVECGGAVVSEQPWDMPPLPWMFRKRNRLIAGLAKATLIVEAGLPSGTFSTADEALAASKDVLVVPGAITSKQSRGANKLIYQGATPIVDDETFHDQMFAIFGSMVAVGHPDDESEEGEDTLEGALLAALAAEQMSVDVMLSVVAADGRVADPMQWLMMWLAGKQKQGVVAKYPGGRYGATVGS